MAAFRLAERRESLWRTGRDEAQRRAQKIPQLVGPYPGQSHEHDGMIHVMIGQVIGLGLFRQQRGALIEISADNERCRFGRFVNGKAR